MVEQDEAPQKYGVSPGSTFVCPYHWDLKETVFYAPTPFNPCGANKNLEQTVT